MSEATSGSDATVPEGFTLRGLVAELAERGTVRVSLPPKGEARDRWLTREEAAALIWQCWRYREKQTIHAWGSKGEPVRTDRRPLRHIARFNLIGLYTGTRVGAIAAAPPYPEVGRSYVDLERGIFYRKSNGKRATRSGGRQLHCRLGYLLTCVVGRTGS